jgi:hypothetical protein
MRTYESPIVRQAAKGNSMKDDATTDELKKLKKENQRLKVLLKNAVDILEKYRDMLKHPEKLGLKPKAAKPKAKKAGRKQK